MTPAALSASSLTGDNVVNRQGEKLGTVKDLMIDLSNGTVVYAVLTRGGFGGVGHKLFAIPWRLLEVDGDQRQVVLDVSPQVLDDSPGFNPDEWPSTAGGEWLSGEPLLAAGIGDEIFHDDTNAFDDDTVLVDDDTHSMDDDTVLADDDAVLADDDAVLADDDAVLADDDAVLVDEDTVDEDTVDEDTVISDPGSDQGADVTREYEVDEKDRNRHLRSD